jgi:hypothetical protein
VSSFDDPTPGHREAISQLAETRSTVRRKLLEINASGGGSGGPHHNLVPPTVTDADGKERSNLPTDRTIATAALSDYILQLRPYRRQSRNWEHSIGAIELPRRVEDGDDRFFEIAMDPTVEIHTLGDVLECAGLRVPYEAPKKGRNAMGTDVKRYVFALSPRQLRELFATADDVAEEIGVLGDLTEPDTTDSTGF